MAIDTYQIAETFPIVTSDMRVAALPWTGGMEFYEGLTERFGNFENHLLVSCHHFDEAWSTWECHPRGDEIVILLSGSATMAVLVDGVVETEELMQSGAYVIVPAGIWHTATAAANATMLFITPGQDTENLEQPPGL